MKSIADNNGHSNLEPIISKKNVILLFTAITLLIIIGAFIFYRNGVRKFYDDKLN